MGRFRAFVILMLFALSAGHGFAAPECAPDGHCKVASGYYMAYAPPEWDRKSAIPVLMHFHGYQESAGDMLAREDLKGFAARRKLLLIVPQGEGNRWSHPGAPSKLRDEFAFIDQVLADLDTRYPIDHSRFLVSGFSVGAAMVWNLACYRGEKFSAFLAIAGTFWTPQPDHCPSGAQNLIQIHGVGDRTVPLEGRAIRSGSFRQGDVFRAMGMMRRANACQPEASRAIRDGVLACEQMSGCASGKTLEICFHPGGHDFDPSWLDHAWRMVEAMPKG